jgi:hypothetical protein
MKTSSHKCSNCNESYDAAKNRAGDLSWRSIFTRPAKMLPLGDDIESFGSVKCPKCGHIENGPQLHLFGIIPGKQVKWVLGALLVLILLFGYWLIQKNSTR